MRLLLNEAFCLVVLVCVGLIFCGHGLSGSSLGLSLPPHSTLPLCQQAHGKLCQVYTHQYKPESLVFNFTISPLPPSILHYTPLQKIDTHTKQSLLCSISPSPLHSAGFELVDGWCRPINKLIIQLDTFVKKFAFGLSLSCSSIICQCAYFACQLQLIREGRNSDFLVVRTK